MIRVITCFFPTERIGALGVAPGTAGRRCLWRPRALQGYREGAKHWPFLCSAVKIGFTSFTEFTSLTCECWDYLNYLKIPESPTIWSFCRSWMNVFSAVRTTCQEDYKEVSHGPQFYDFFKEVAWRCLRHGRAIFAIRQTKTHCRLT